MKKGLLMTGASFAALTGCTGKYIPEDSLSVKPIVKPSTTVSGNPNVVIIVADDLGYGDISCHGGYVSTPNIDRIFSDGIELTRYYTAPVSSPTRCGLMTGRYPSRFGIRKTVIPPWRDYGLDETEETMADVLAKNGYSNRAIIGKWHMGHSRWRYYPLNRGFTHFHGCLNGALDYFTHIRDGELDWHDDWLSSYEEGYTTDLIAGHAADCIKKYAAKDPYLTYICFNAPHSPYEAPQEEIDALISPTEFAALGDKAKKGWTYRAMVARLDKGVGQILDAIERSGEKENTIVLFMSDNGGVPNLKPYCTNIGLRGNKFDEFEGGLRTAAAIYWPKGFQNARKCDQVTGFVDILPTLRDIIGDTAKPNRPYDGISVFPVLKGDKDYIERDIYLGLSAAVNQYYKLILKSGNSSLGLANDLFVNIAEHPDELDSYILTDPELQQHLREVVAEGDAIVPCQEELPYGSGQNGFVAPKEWIPTED